MEHIWTEADSLDWRLFEAFGDLEDLLQEVSIFLSNSKARRQVHAEAYYGYSPDLLLQEVEEIDRQVGQEFPRVIAYSLVMLTYSQFEFFLMEIGDLLCKTLGLPAGIRRSGRGSLVERAELFFKTSSLSAWSATERQHFADFTLVRNCLVHNDGLLMGNRKEPELREIVDKNEGLGISKWHTMVVSLDYCRVQTQLINSTLRRILFENFYPEEASNQTSRKLHNHQKREDLRHEIK